MHRHLIPVEVSIKAFTDEGMQQNGISFHENRFKSLDSHAMQRRGTIEKHGMIADDFFEDIPDLFILPFQHFLCTFDRVGVP